MNGRASRRVRRQRPGARVLYLSYDGMCDPLGASQVLPYLTGLAKRGHEITLLSFEKPERTQEERAAAAKLCSDAGIEWRPLAYHKRPPVLSTIYDMRRMRGVAERLNREQRFDLVHCRSYLATLVGLSMKRRHGLPFIFDMRGFWADERVDGGIWNLKNPLFRAIYRYFKKREHDFLTEADQVVSLTEQGTTVLLKRGKVRAPITVIPCCVDFAAFPPITGAKRRDARRRLGIAADAKVAAYLGSFVDWYMIEEMLAFFRVQRSRDPEAMFLIVTQQPAEEIVAIAESHGVGREHLIVRAASRVEVPQLMAAADYSVFFMRPTFANVARSPTKLGECLALELPVISNGEVGDIGRIIDETGAGVLVGGFEERSYGAALDALARLAPDMNRWRAAARRWFDLETGVERYETIYQNLAHGS